MGVYLRVANYYSAQNGVSEDMTWQKFTPPQKVTAQILDETIALPYFKAFTDMPLPLTTLYGYLVKIIQQTVQQAGWTEEELRHCPILLGSTAYVIADCEYRVAHDSSLPQPHTLTAIANHLRAVFQTEVYSFATSCTSSAQAMQSAYQMIQNGFYEKCLVLGFEMFNRLTFEHFQSMQLLAHHIDYQPLMQQDGLILGEGIACVALSSQASDTKRCEIMGMSSVTDSANLTNSSSEALVRLWQKVLQQSQLDAKQIRAVKVHGVGGSSDAMEIPLLQRYFPHSELILAKSYFGHTLGAGGALETAFLFNCLQRQQLPTLPYQPVEDSMLLAHGKPLLEGFYLNYFLGFGGSNVAWILDWRAN